MSNSALPSVTALSGLLLAGFLGTSSPLTAQWSEQHLLLQDGGAAGHAFGASVATDGVLVVVGAPGSDDLGDDSGAASVFGAASGALLRELLPTDGAAGDAFGASVAVDGPYVVVGAPDADAVAEDAGAAYVFDAATGVQLLALDPGGLVAGDRFGVDVAIDGGHVVVGALGGAYLFDATTGALLESLVPVGGLPVGGTGVAIIDGGFGESVDVGGGRVVVGAKTANGASLYAGAAYVFDTSGVELHVLSTGPAWSQFGGSVAIDGDTVAVGARYASPNGKDSGAAFLYDAVTGQQVASLAPTDGHIFQHFGSAVDVDGMRVVIGAEWDNEAVFAAGAAYVYGADGGGPVAKLLAGAATANDELGEAVAVAGDVVVAGAARDDDLGDASGSASMFGPSAWTDMGGGSPGSSGTPALAGEGTLVGGTPAGVFLSSAPADAPVVGWLSLAPVPFDALGGTVHAYPFVNQWFFSTDAAGELSAGTTWPAGLPSGTDFWVQFICQDAPGPGLVLSNAVRGRTP